MNEVKSDDLTKEVVEILDKHSNGSIVVFSFGSLFSTKDIKRQTKIEILRAFEQFPNTAFIWKFDSSDTDFDLLEDYPNVHPLNWLPQGILKQLSWLTFLI